jgi:2'-5' RNA ligase
VPRLFVAIDFPDELKAELLRLQPPSGCGVRPTKPEQLHLTLHFLGDAELQPAVDALQTVNSSAFSLAFAGVGKFGSARRETILWAGMVESVELQRLHHEIASALLPTGYQPEPRPFHPHITLARCQPRTPRTVIDEFLTNHAGWHYPEVTVAEIVLYSSVLTPTGSVYRRESTRLLRA